MHHHSRDKIGRNEPCPCGSGRKYKQCCLAGQAPSTDSVWQRQHDESVSMAQGLMKFAVREFGERIYEAWQDFNMSEEPKALEDSDKEMPIFMPYYLYQWRPYPHPSKPSARQMVGVVAQAYLAEKAARIGVRERLLLEQATTQPNSFFEVVTTNPGHGMIMRDVLTGWEVELVERSASQSVRPGDLLYGQIWMQPEFNVLGSSSHLAIPPDKKIEVIELRKKLRRKIARQKRDLTAADLLRYADDIRETYLDIRDWLYAPPRITNTDGDPLLFHTMKFRIESAHAAFKALAHLEEPRTPEEMLQEAEYDEAGQLRAVQVAWVRKGNRKFKTWENTVLGHLDISGTTLTAEVNSENRARLLRAEIDKQLGSQAVHLSTITKSVDELRASRPEVTEQEKRAERESLLQDPEVRKQLQAHIQKQTEGWVNEKLPILRGKTPMQAVRDPDGRESVEALLREWEQSEEKDDGFGNLLRPDVGAIRRLLKLDAPT